MNVENLELLLNSFVNVLSFLLSFSKHPIVVGLVLFWIGKIFWLDKFIISNKASEDTKLKKEVIEKIYQIKNKIKKVVFYYDRTVLTNKAFKKESKVFPINVLKGEFSKISTILNDDIPILLSDIKSFLTVYFDSVEKIDSAYDIYEDSVYEIHKFLVQDLMKKEDFGLKRIEEYGIDFTELHKGEKLLVKNILDSQTIFFE